MFSSYGKLIVEALMKCVGKCEVYSQRGVLTIVGCTKLCHNGLM